MSEGKGKEVTVTKFNKDQEVWISVKSEEMWEKAYVDSQNGVFVQVYQGKRKKTLNLLQDAVFPTNPRAQPDMTSLYFINEPCILMNLEERSLKDEPYTFMGNVLVAVNPLKNIKNPSMAEVKANPPHPFSVAENSFRQLGFAYDHKKYHSDSGAAHEQVNQSIVTSGESGAGKTEQCKMVLKHLVDRCSNEDSAEIDKQLLESNFITESFGNAQTLRNHNSSRFGKFLKLFFVQQPVVKGHVPKWNISGATVQTYLLERSRVVFHGEKERNYHIFYHLLAGLDAAQRKAYGFDEASANCGFRYLSALKSNKDATTDAHVGIGAFKKEQLKTDAEEFKRMQQAMYSLGFDQASAYETFKIAAGVLHLGNVTFDNEFKDGADIAVPRKYGSYNPAKWAAELLGFESEEVIRQLLVEEKLTIRGNTIVKVNDNPKACDMRDSVSKGLYSLLFDHVISVIDRTLNGKSANDEDTPYIGVLDIFGFETFDRNGFEQLLINFANEALQATFNKSVFENEAALYKRERLVLDGEEMHEPPSNTAAMQLFVGHPDTNGKMLAGEISGGLLLAIDDACQSLEPSDKKMISRLHRNFTKHKNYKLPHAKLMNERFVIVHFAGKVSYTVGFFVEKNKDKLPKQVQEVFESSTSTILKEIVGQSVQTKRNATVVKKFRKEIQELVDTLEATNTSFIRCVKPNFHLVRPNNNKGWFVRKYISMQLRNLSIPQTAEVLQNGFPTRLTYKSLLDQYRSLLPDSAMSRWSKSGGQEEVFVKALFYAFQVEDHIFKLGLTMVFFRSGELAKLDDILRVASNWKEKSKKEREQIIERFIFYYTRMQWRRLFARMVAAKKFLQLLELVRERERIRLEEERKRKEAERLLAEKKKKEAEALAAQEEAEKKKEEEAQEAVVTEQLKFEEKFEEALETPEEELKGEQLEFRKIDKEFYEQAAEEVEREVGSKREQRPSVTSEIIRVEIEERVKNFRKKYAMEQAIQNVRKAVEDTTKTTVKGYLIVVKWIQDTWENTRQIREDIERRNQAMLKLFISEARKQPWFRRAHDELLRLDAEFKKHLADVENADDRVKKKPKVNLKNLKRTKSVLVISEEEARTPLVSAQRQVSELDLQLKNNQIQPNDYADAVEKMKQEYEDSKKREYTPSYQFSPKNSDLDDSASSVESVLAPSQDTDGGWCKMPIRYNGGLFYVKSEVTNDKKNFTLICGYEKTIDGKLEKTVWEVDGTAGEFALLYDSILNNKKLAKIKGMPEFPYWNADAYNKGKKGAFGKLFSRVDREKKVQFLASCIMEVKLREKPSELGAWLEEVFKVVYGNTYKPKGSTEDTNIFFTQTNEFMLDATVYCRDDIFE